MNDGKKKPKENTSVISEVQGQGNSPATSYMKQQAELPSASSLEEGNSDFPCITVHSRHMLDPTAGLIKAIGHYLNLNEP